MKVIARKISSPAVIKWSKEALGLILKEPMFIIIGIGLSFFQFQIADMGLNAVLKLQSSAFNVLTLPVLFFLFFHLLVTFLFFSGIFAHYCKYGETPRGASQSLLSLMRLNIDITRLTLPALLLITIAATIFWGNLLEIELLTSSEESRSILFLCCNALIIIIALLALQFREAGYIGFWPYFTGVLGQTILYQRDSQEGWDLNKNLLARAAYWLLTTQLAICVFSSLFLFYFPSTNVIGQMALVGMNNAFWGFLSVILYVMSQDIFVERV